MKSKNQDITIKIDATDKILGRLASEISQILRDKSSVNFSYNKAPNKKVIVYNANEILTTGNKMLQKKYYRHSGYLGNLKEITLEKLFEKDPAKVLNFAVKGMLPKNRLQKEFLKNLTILKGDLNAK